MLVQSRWENLPRLLSSERRHAGDVFGEPLRSREGVSDPRSVDRTMPLHAIVAGAIERYGHSGCAVTTRPPAISCGEVHMRDIRTAGRKPRFPGRRGEQQA